MARIEESMHGHFTDKVGNLVGGKWNGVDQIRSLPKRNNTEATPSQQSHRSKMAFAGSFTRTIKQVAKVVHTWLAFILADGKLSLTALISV